jgi:thioesterase domain-containing protein
MWDRIEAQGLDGSLPPQLSIQAMASRYLEELRRVQPNGPFLLGGWSMGGVVAFEMAQQLRSFGEEVALLALIDSRAPAGESSNVPDADLLHAFAVDLGVQPYPSDTVVDDLSFTRQLSRILSIAKEAGKASPEITISAFRRFFEVFKTNLNAMRAYAPSMYAGRITIFRADGSLPLKRRDRVNRFFQTAAAHRRGQVAVDKTMGWGKWAVGGVECYEVPGNHYTIVDEPGVETLAEQIRFCAQQAETPNQI